MARNRTRRPWITRLFRVAQRPWPRGGSAAGADVPFFEDAAKWRLRRDSPEVSVFTPAEEAESHKRWKRAVLRGRFHGPVSDAERLGFGLSAAALAALAAAEKEADADEEANEEAAPHWRADAEDAGEVFAALKSAAMGQAANKPAVAAKPVGAAARASMDTDEDGAFSNPISSRTDNGGFGARRTAAPRGSGAPPESRVGAAERVEITVLRKAEQAPGDARAPLPGDAATSAAIRGPAEAQAAAMAIAMAAELPEVREDAFYAQPKTASGADARANQAQASAEAASAQAKAKDAPPAAEAKADGRQGPAVEAAGRDRAGDAPPSAAGAKAAADPGRGAAEAPGRAKASDAAPGVVVAAETGSDRKGSAAAEAPAEAKAKDVAPAAEVEAGPSQKPAKALAQAKAAEVVVLEAKATGPEKGTADSHGAAKAEDARLVVEAKAEPTRQTAEAPGQTTAEAIPAVAVTDTVHVNGSASTSALDQAKTTDAAAEKAIAAHGPAEAAAQAANAAVPPAAAAKAEATHAATADKAVAAHTPTEAAAQAAKAADLPATTTAAEKAATAPHGPAEAAAQTAAATAPLAATTATEKAVAAKAETAFQPATAKDPGATGTKADPSHSTAAAPGPAEDAAPPRATETDAGRDHAQAPGQAKAAEVLPAAAEAKAGQVPGAPAEAFADPTKAKDALADGTKPDPIHAPVEAQAHTAPKDAVPAVADAKAGLGSGLVEAPKQAKAADVLPAVAETKADSGIGAPETIEPAKAADTTPAVAGSKGAQDPAGHAETPAVLVKAEDVAAPAPDPAHHQAEPPSPAKSAPAAVAAAVPGAAKAEQAAQTAQAHDSAQHGDAAGAVPAVSPAADTLDLHVTGLWPEGGERPEQSQGHVSLPEKAAQPVPHATDPAAGADGERGTAAAVPVDGGSSGAAAALVSSPGAGEKGAAGTPGTVAPGSAHGKGDTAAPANKAADAGPVGTEKQAAAKPSGETADGVVLDTVVKLEKASGHALTEAEAFALLSVANPGAADAGRDGLTAGDILAQGHPGLNASALDSAWRDHFVAHDAVLL